MNDHDIHALSGAYAVDALDDLERARFERHLENCSVCRDEVGSLQETTAELAELSATTPPPMLRSRVLDEIRSVRPLPPETQPTTPHRRVRGSRWRPFLVAASVVAAIGVGAVVVDQITGDETTQTVTAAERVLAAGDAVSVAAKMPGGATARVVHSASEGKAVLVASGMKDLPEGKVYELWLQHDDVMVPAGLFRNGSGTVLFEGDPNTAQAAGITIEPAGGSPEPTSAPVALFDLTRAT